MSIFNKLFSSNAKSYDKYGDVLKKIMTTKEQRLVGQPFVQGNRLTIKMEDKNEGKKGN